MKRLSDHLTLYESEHQTAGCKLTHMFGVPMIAAVPFVIVGHPALGIVLLLLGCLLQYAGHRVFERNRPLLAKNPFDPLTYAAALVFVTQEWFGPLTGRGI